MTELVVCKVCNEPLTDTNWTPSRKRIGFKRCSSCEKIRRKAYYAESGAKDKREWSRINIKNTLVNRAHNRAKKKGVPFNLTIHDFEIPDTCPVLNIPMFIGDGKVGPNSPSLDRIDPSLGYTKDNVAVISHRANTIKNDANLEELQKVTAWLNSKINDQT